MSNRRYSFIRSIFPENALNFSRRTRFVRESMIERIYPSKIILPMLQHFGEEAVPVVEVGDSVLIGQCIGKPAAGSYAVPIHSGISGKVTEIKNITLPNGITTKAVVIESDRKRTNHSSIRPRSTTNIDAQTTISIIRNAGIVGQGGEGIPTVAKINRARRLGVQELLVNCLQSEPYATCDLYRICEMPDYVVRGAIALAGVTGVSKIRFLLSENRKKEYEFLKNAIDNASQDYDGFTFEIVRFKERFPQGYYRLITRALYSVELEENEIMEQKVGAVLFNCSTCSSCWEAIADGIPMMNRVVTVSGDTMDGHNVLVPIGTPIRDLLSKMSPVFSSCKIVWGNALTGLSCTDLDTPIVKTIGALTVIKLVESPRTPCIHCGMCFDACPMDISPDLCWKLIKEGHNEFAEIENANKCIACGACSYVCPAGLDLTGTIATFARQNKERRDYNNSAAFTRADVGEDVIDLFEDNEDISDSQGEIDDDKIFIPFEGGKNV